MKKNNLFKVLIVTFICFVFLSWIIPTGEFTNGSFTDGGISPIGLFDLTLIPLSVFDIALTSIIFILIVGGFYGVMNKTGVYATMIETFTKKLKGKEVKFLVIVTVIMTLLSSLVGLNIGFFFIIPFISAILLSLGFSKIVTMLSTIGSILVGMIASIYGSDISYYLNGYLGYSSDFSYHTSLFPDKIVLFILLTFLLVLYLIKLGRKNISESKKSMEEIPLYEKVEKSKRSWKPLFIILISVFILICVGYFKWDSILGLNSEKTPFLDFYNNIMKISIGDFPIVQSIFGSIPAIGYWQLPFIAVFTLFITIIIGLVYKVKFDDFIDGFGDGLKKTLKIALYIIGANLVFAGLFKNGTSANIAASIVNYLMNLADRFNSFIYAITTMISSVFYNSFGTLTSTLYTPTVILTGSTAGLRFLASLILQTIYGLVMFIAPTSVLLIAGLSYFNISYKEWFKNVWKLLLQLLVVIVLIIIIVTIFSV